MEKDKEKENWVEWKDDEYVEQFVYKNSDKLLPAFLSRCKSIYEKTCTLLFFWKK